VQIDIQAGNISFVLIREIEDSVSKKWTRAGIASYQNIDWSGIKSIEVSYTSNKNLKLYLTDSKRSEAGSPFSTNLPAGKNKEIKIDVSSTNFRQPKWVQNIDASEKVSNAIPDITGICVNTPHPDKNEVIGAIHRLVLIGAVYKHI
jgi:hypothetical protein